MNFFWLFWLKLQCNKYTTCIQIQTVVLNMSYNHGQHRNSSLAQTRVCGKRTSVYISTDLVPDRARQAQKTSGSTSQSTSRALGYFLCERFRQSDLSQHEPIGRLVGALIGTVQARKNHERYTHPRDALADGLISSIPKRYYRFQRCASPFRQFPYSSEAFSGSILRIWYGRYGKCRSQRAMHALRSSR